MEKIQRIASWARELPPQHQAYFAVTIVFSTTYFLNSLAHLKILPVLGGVDWSGVTKNSTYMIIGIVAIAASYFYEGNDGLRRIFRPYLKFRFNVLYWLFAAFILIPILYLTLLLDDFLYLRGFNIHPMTLPTWAEIKYFAPQFLQVAVCDELFWIGFVYPRLVQAGYSPLKASLTMGLLWGMDYMPLFFTQFFVAPGLNLPNIILGWLSLTPLYVWLYYRTGSALVVLLFNLSMQFLFTAIPVLPQATGDNQATAMANLVCLSFGFFLWIYFPKTRLPAPPPIGAFDSKVRILKTREVLS